MASRGGSATSKDQVRSWTTSISVWLGGWALVAAMLTYAGRLSLFPSWNLDEDKLLRHGLYALCWGCIGACINAARALAQHCAADDFDLRWNWWYWSKPPLGALIGLITYVLMKGLTAFVGPGTLNDGANGLAVAAIATVAGFATERVLHKLEAVSRTLFEVSPVSAKLSIALPAANQAVLGPLVDVAVGATGPVSWVSASCVEDPAPAVALVQDLEGYFRGQLTLSAPKPSAPEDRTVRVVSVANGEAIEASVVIKY
jgi:hypothetical protein